MADIIPHHMMVLEGEKEIDLENDTLKCILTDDTYSPDADDDTYETGSDPFDSEIANGNGYTTGGETLTNVTVTDDDANDRAIVDCDDISWTASGGSIGPARYAVVYDDSVANKPLVYIFDLGENKTAGDGTPFKINIDDSGSGWFTKSQA